MFLNRLTEEECIVLKEIKNHWKILKREHSVLNDHSSHIAVEMEKNSKYYIISCLSFVSSNNINTVYPQ